MKERVGACTVHHDAFCVPGIIIMTINLVLFFVRHESFIRKGEIKIGIRKEKTKKRGRIRIGEKIID